MITLALSANLAVFLAGCGNNGTTDPLENALKDFSMDDADLLKEIITVTFEADADSCAGAIFDKLSIIKDK